MVEEKEIYKLISETMHEGLLELDLHGKIVRANPAALSMLGFTLQEITQKTHRDLTPAKWHQLESQAIQETNLAQHKDIVLEQEYLRKNGSVFPVALKPILLTGPDQKPIKIIILCQDLTRQKEQERLRQDHQRQLNSLSLITRKLQENDTVDQTVHFVLEALAAAMKYPEVAVPLIAIEDETFSTNKYSDELDYGLTASIFVNGREAGEVTVYYSENKPFVLPDEQHILETVAQSLGVWLTQKSAAQELADMEEQYQSIFDSMADGFALYEIKDEGRELIVMDWNRAAEKMYNLLRHDVLGQDIKKFFPAMEKTDVYKAIVECSRSGETETIPLVHYQDAQHDQYMHNIIYRAGDKVVVIFRDVTAEEKDRQDLVRSEQKFRSLIEGSAEAVYLHSMDPVDPRFVDINQSACQMLHYTREELLALGPAKIDSPENAALVPERIAKILNDGEALFESEQVTKDGQRIPVEINASVVEFGGQKHILSFVRDITEHKKSEAALRKQQQELNIILDSSPTMIFYKDKENNFVRVNQAMAKGNALTKKEMEGKSVFDLYPREIADKYWQDDKTVIAEGQPKLNIIESMETKEGLKWVQTDKIPYKNEKGEIIGVVGFALDITERRQAEVALRVSEAQLLNAAYIAHLGSWEYDVANDVFTFTDNFYAIFHTTAEQVGGYTMSSADYARRFVHPEDAAVVGLEVRKAIESDDPNFSRQLEHRIIYSNGEVGYISVRFFIIKDEQGRTVRTYGVNQDITERKRTEEELKKRINELDRFNKVTMEREKRIIELKKKVKELEQGSHGQK